MLKVYFSWTNRSLLMLGNVLAYCLNAVRLDIDVAYSDCEKKGNWISMCKL